MTACERIYVGGWFQRTMLHLSEIYDFLHEASSPLKGLEVEKLVTLQSALALESVEMKVADLDYIVARSVTNNVEFKIFEDGLIVLSTTPTEDLPSDVEKLTAYYENELSAALSYIFSLGAPIPKELANIKTVYPYFFVLNDAPKDTITELLATFKQQKYFEIVNDSFEIYRGNKLYTINTRSVELEKIEHFVQEQIFVREFKGQLHRYLNLHRIIWERIADIKERGQMKGSEVGPLRDKIEGYSKTINLIDARIDQMESYIHTREAIVRSNEAYEAFVDVLEFKYETLADTLQYVKGIWTMTKNYVEAALTQFSELHSRIANKSIENLTIVTTMGVGATLIGLFTNKVPGFTWYGLLYFFILALIGYSTGRLISFFYNRKSYSVRGVEAAKNIE